jgi:D-glycero-alpha-D-manno-heptose-7-phosphate kinase
VNTFRARAPLRISFAGGGTDVPPFPEREGGLVLNATINRYAYGTLRPRADDSIQIESYDFGTSAVFPVHEPLVFDGKLDLAKAPIRRLAGRDTRGFDLMLHSNAPPGSGLGSSSTMMVTLIGLLKEHRNLALTDYDLARLAFTLEREDLGIRGGLQDHYAAVFGGFNFIELYGERVIVNPLRISPDVILELEYNLLLCYTGKTRDSGQVIEDQTSRFEAGQEDTVGALRKQKELAVEMKNALLQRRLGDFGELLDNAWQAKKQMSSRISNPRIEELYDEGRKAGALGAKVTGAGGGGYLLFYCGAGSKHKVGARMLDLRAEVEEFAFEPEGLRSWRVYED